MPLPLTMLLVEDNPADAELVLRELRRGGFEPVWQLVDTETALAEKLTQGPDLDLIISDFSLPQFSGFRALELLKESGREVPFILVSGTIGEDLAVTAMKKGAADYLLKDRLARLGPAVTQALQNSRLNRERRQADLALRESEERFRQVVENIHEVFWMKDVEKNMITYISPGYEQIWGRKREELYASSEPWVESIQREDRERMLRTTATRPLADGFDESYRIVRPDGTVRWIRNRAFPIMVPEGAVRRVVGVAEDITERKALEEQFLQAQRMEAIGMLASGVAHDLNNILSPILMVAGLLKETAEGVKEREMLTLMEQSGRRGASLIQQLLTFSRGTAGERVIVQPRHLVRDMVHIMHETFPRNITVVESVPGNLWTVEADPTKLHQVIMNLCVNARDAMSAGGTLTLAAANTVVAPDTPVDCVLKPGPHLLITVQDNGHGIPPAIISRIFDPFFTTKEVGKGTGLGLSTVVGIVRDHGGVVKVESEPGRGTTFRVYLPALAEGHEIKRVDSKSPVARGRGELILLVDDEAPIREAGKGFLERSGYRVLLADSGEEAIKLIIQHQGALRLVLTDLMMPGMDGLALIRALRILEPEISVIVSSGLDERLNHDELAALAISEVLAKPCEPERLINAISAALAR